MEYAGPLVEIGFNASYMIEFLRALPTPEAKFLFKDGQSAGEMQPGEASEQLTYRYVVMPMRI